MPEGMLGTPGRFRTGLDWLIQGRPERAVPLLEAALDAGEDAPWAGLNLALAYVQLGRIAPALPLLEAAAVALPDHAEVRFHLATVLGLRNETDRAALCYSAALERDPDHLLSLAGLAAIEESAGRHTTAAALVDRARRLAPDEPELDIMGGRLALAAGDAETAEADATRALDRRPGHVRAASLLAEALRSRLGGEAAAAEVAARAEAEPMRPDWPLVAAALDGRAGRLNERVGELRVAAALLPESSEVLAELGKALWEADQRSEAEAVLRQAIVVRPGDIDLRNWLATLLWRMQRPTEMLAWLDSAAADFGPAPTLEVNRALALNALGEQDAAVAAADAAAALQQTGASALIARMQVLAYHQEHGHAAALLAAGRAIAERLGPPPPRPERDRDPQRRLRVGLLSGSFGAHPVGWLTVAGFEALATNPEFELFAYALRPRRDGVNSRFRAICRGWRELAAVSDAAVAAAIVDDGCDILIDLGGYGDSGRPYALQRRPAPVTVKWVGSQFATMGLDCIDWMLTDRWETPPGAEQFYTERLLRLPDGYVCFSPPPYAPPVAPTPALARGHVTFGCFNNLAKITPHVLALWARILATLPDARLELRTQTLSEAGTRERVVARCAAAGLPMERLLLHPGCRHPQLLGAYGDIDIALDPFPYAGGLTVCEALWMGVPVVAMAGDSFSGRHAVSHLSNVGLPDWIATDADSYHDLAVARAQDIPALAKLRRGVRAQVAASPLCDAPRFGRNLAAALRAAWEAYCRES